MRRTPMVPISRPLMPRPARLALPVAERQGYLGLRPDSKPDEDGLLKV